MNVLKYRAGKRTLPLLAGCLSIALLLGVMVYWIWFGKADEQQRSVPAAKSLHTHSQIGRPQSESSQGASVETHIIKASPISIIRQQSERTSSPVRLRIQAQSTIQANSGEAVEVQISNVSQRTLESVELITELPKVLQHPEGQLIRTALGAIAPGQCVTTTLHTQCTNSGAGVIHARATALDVPPVDAERQVEALPAPLDVVVWGPNHLNVGSTGTLAIHVVNNSRDNISEFLVKIKLPDGLEPKSVSGNGSFDPSERTVSWPMNVTSQSFEAWLGLELEAVATGNHTGSVEMIRKSTGPVLSREWSMVIAGHPHSLKPIPGTFPESSNLSRE